jgi:protein NEDD1
MLAAATNGGITLTSPSTLKRVSSNIPTTIVLCGSPSALAWSLDRNTLFYAQGDVIHHYTADNSSNEGPVYTAEPRGSTVSHVVCPTTSSLVYATERAVTFTNASHTERCVELDSPITSLTSVYDSKYVVYTTSTTATFHNIATHTAISLGGLLLSKGAAIAASAAHHHSSERIVLVGGSSLFVYDINHPSAPVKTIDTSGPSPLDFVTCSPFSRTLVAVGSTSGMVQLVDLEKEKRFVVPLNTSARRAHRLFLVSFVRWTLALH